MISFEISDNSICVFRVGDVVTWKDRLRYWSIWHLVNCVSGNWYEGGFDSHFDSVFDTMKRKSQLFGWHLMLKGGFDSHFDSVLNWERGWFNCLFSLNVFLLFWLGFFDWERGYLWQESDYLEAFKFKKNVRVNVIVSLNKRG